MPVIKIHELPVKNLDDLNPEDIMVVEDTMDTKQMTIHDLQIFFSNDKKIQSVTDMLNGKISDLSDKFDDLYRETESANEELEAKFTNLYNDHELTKQRLGRLQEEVLDIEKHNKEQDKQIAELYQKTSDLNDLAIEHGNRLDALEKDNETNKSNIADLQADNETNKENIVQLQKDTDQLSKKLTAEVERLDDRISTLDTDMHTYADGVYDTLMKYIDYYHHVHENPPNFDEPYKGDPIVANYIHPVGTIFETFDPEFEINKWFPGVWKFCGVGCSFDKDGNRQVDYYTWRRVQ